MLEALVQGQGWAAGASSSRGGGEEPDLALEDEVEDDDSEGPSPNDRESFRVSQETKSEPDSAGWFHQAGALCVHQPATRHARLRPAGHQPAVAAAAATWCPHRTAGVRAAPKNADTPLGLAGACCRQGPRHAAAADREGRHQPGAALPAAVRVALCQGRQAG